MKYAIANWKMNMTEESIAMWVKKWNELDTNTFHSFIMPIIAPSYIHLHNDMGLKKAAQDISINQKGAHTGDVGAFQIKDYCTHCIVGHSERSESHGVVMQKAHSCIEVGITPIICFVNPTQAAQYYIRGCIMAWEDPDNISIEGIFKPKAIDEIKEGMDTALKLLPGDAVLLYGGSVNRDNSRELKALQGLSGVLVGSASLDPMHFYDICKNLI